MQNKMRRAQRPPRPFSGLSSLAALGNPVGAFGPHLVGSIKSHGLSLALISRPREKVIRVESMGAETVAVEKPDSKRELHARQTTLSINTHARCVVALTPTINPTR